MRWTRIVAFSWLALGAGAIAQTAQVDIDKLGPQGGDRAMEVVRSGGGRLATSASPLEFQA